MRFQRRIESKINASVMILKEAIMLFMIRIPGADSIMISQEIQCNNRVLKKKYRCNEINKDWYNSRLGLRPCGEKENT